MIVKGKVITGVSGGEFGIVGKVEARDAKTGELVWSRPVIEGHMGTLNGKESTMTGTLNATWEGDQWKQGGGATGWAAPTTRKPTPSSWAPATRRRGTRGPQGRQPVHRLHPGHQPGQRRNQVAPANHAA